MWFIVYSHDIWIASINSPAWKISEKKVRLGELLGVRSPCPDLVPRVGRSTETPHLHKDPAEETMLCSYLQENAVRSFGSHYRLDDTSAGKVTQVFIQSTNDLGEI